MGEVLILREPEIRSLLSMDACIEAVGAAFGDHSAGRAELPDVIHLDVPEHGGEVHVKAGHLHGRPYYAAKFASGFYAGPVGAYDGMVVVFDAANGAPAALLVDHGFITDLRTGAAGGVAARHLAPEPMHRVAVIGSGTQARYQIDGLARVRAFDEVRVWGRNPERAAACVEDLRVRHGMPAGVTVRAASSVEDAVDGADVVITCTASTEPLVRADWLVPGAHVTALGSDGPRKRELDVSVLAAADLLVCDSVPQCARIGELHHALDSGVVDEAKAVELGAVVGGAAPGRTSRHQLTVCDLTGVGVQDVAAALVVMAGAAERGWGERVRV